VDVEERIQEPILKSPCKSPFNEKGNVKSKPIYNLVYNWKKKYGKLLNTLIDDENSKEFRYMLNHIVIIVQM